MHVHSPVHTQMVSLTTQLQPFRAPLRHGIRNTMCDSSWLWKRVILKTGQMNETAVKSQRSLQLKSQRRRLSTRLGCCSMRGGGGGGRSLQIWHR